jgi:hypothetical protein
MKQSVMTLLFAVISTRRQKSRELDGKLAGARQLFRQYVELGAGFDEALADLYADDAEIVNLRQSPQGQARKIVLDGAEYKRLIRASLPMAQGRGDLSDFTEVSYQYDRKQDAVRIRANRYSKLKDYSSPMQWLVKPDADGTWFIVWEQSESRS